VSVSLPKPPARRARPQRGAALLTAMIIVTLIATLAASMVWQQWRAVQVETAERARAQSAWILSGALDWARLILREDARNNRTSATAVDHLGEPWAVPLAEARLSTFLAADKTSTDDAPDAFLSGAITDAQALYNLNNLITSEFKIDAAEVAALGHLCESANVSVDVAGRIAAGLLKATGPGNADPAAPLLPASVSQLVWLGIDPATLRRLAPYVILLPPTPAKTKVNVNTASREVLAAMAGVDLASAERLIQLRQHTPFKAVDAIERELPGLSPDDRNRLRQRVATGSDFFQVRGRLRLGDRVLEQTSLVERRGLDVVVRQRERVSSRDQPGA
jgi:general secretion pathway protein K